MTITSKRRAELRAEAHHLAAVVHVGNHGLSDAVLESIDDALRTRELVKVQLGKHVESTAKEAAALLSTRLHADVVQVIGKVVALYRENPDLPHKPDSPPAWRR